MLYVGKGKALDRTTQKYWYGLNIDQGQCKLRSGFEFIETPCVRFIRHTFLQPTDPRLRCLMADDEMTILGCGVAVRNMMIAVTIVTNMESSGV